MMRFLETIEFIDEEEVLAKFMEGGLEYGEFRIDSIDSMQEITEEIIDLICYQAISDMQNASRL